MLTALAAEARSGFPRMRGTRVSGTIPVTQSLLNELVAGASVVPEIEILDGNRVVTTVWGMSVTATIVGVDPSLVVRLELPWIARRLAGVSPYTRPDGEHVLIDLGLLPQLAAWRHVWRHLTSIRIETTAGRLVVHFELTIA